MKLWRTILPYYVMLGVICLPATAVLNAHLLNQRPAISGQEENGRPNVLCGRVSGPAHCVKISDTDSRIYTLLLTLSILSVPGVLFWIFSLQASLKSSPPLGMDS